MNNKDLTLSQTIEYVADFHRAFGLPVRTAPTADLPQTEKSLRFNLMKEENEEYLDAAEKGDLVEIADALGDMLYILCGTINAHGLQYKITEVFEEIQRSNMSKLGEDGKPIYREDGKVMKGPHYFRPNIQHIIEK
jgi:predicted HAD superfamily Cof-like phosphohydrolase